MIAIYEVREGTTAHHVGFRYQVDIGPDGPIYLTEAAMKELYREFGKILEGSE